MNKLGFIDCDSYKKIYKLVPITCVDVLVTCNNEFLLSKRMQKPAIDQWFVPDGWILRNEKLKKVS